MTTTDTSDNSCHHFTTPPLRGIVRAFVVRARIHDDFRGGVAPRTAATSWSAMATLTSEEEALYKRYFEGKIQNLCGRDSTFEKLRRTDQVQVRASHRALHCPRASPRLAGPRVRTGDRDHAVQAFLPVPQRCRARPASDHVRERLRSPEPQLALTRC